MIDRFLFGTEAPARVRAVRVALGVLVGLRLALGPYAVLADQPAALFRPVWFLGLLPAMPPPALLVGLQVLGTAVALVAATARKWWAFALAWLCLLVLAGLRGSQGKVLHNDVLLLLVCVPFLAARGDEEGWPVRTAMVVVAGAYFFCGWRKLTTAGLDWVTTDNVRFVMLAAARSGRALFPDVAGFVARSDWLCHAIAAATMLFELSFPVVLLRPRLRPVYVAAAVTLHAGTWLALALDYWVWAGVVLAVMAAGTRLRPRPGPAGAAPGAPPARRATAGTPGEPAYG